MLVATFNVNGIRASEKRGFFGWLAHRNPDVVALQEVRATAELVPAFPNHWLTYDEGTLPGRNGVGILTREAPAAVRTWSGTALVRGPGERHTALVETEVVPHARGLHEFALEGRYAEVDLADAPLTVASLYLPKGGLPAHLQKPGRMRDAPDGGRKYERKMRFLNSFARQADRARRAAQAKGRDYLLMGDFNIAPDRWDVRNWRRASQSEGFLPEEREWLASLMGSRRLVDVLRAQLGEVDGPYSWWSWMPGAFDRDTGWRIDLHLATPRLARTATAAYVDREPSADRRLSDHAPVLVDFALS
ncbi:exodeoxyribonuclease III [Calidifontibacter sp. DB0510]|uniref:Exodeoxyribonuclease III n=1 Tax=Metallococcus carri TaxID=1656884 RepID=A0A967B2N0_9MICO|nr:exodeoxyribonuclease III [Metallococcus carri]NHN56155.1 exodeoxyribonuclease III [Metallococcus carri]NOP38794.1 exodeoxyribonuclease III [Calidifontibacter sp. DB2511S]